MDDFHTLDLRNEIKDLLRRKQCVQGLFAEIFIQFFSDKPIDTLHHATFPIL